MTSSNVIDVAALIIRNTRGRVLCVRKIGSPRFQLPGGKPQPAETELQAVVRETKEEIGLAISAEDLGFLGTYSASASNEPGFLVTATVFEYANASDAARVASEAKAANEIEEIAWIDPMDHAEFELAPLLQLQIFPALRQREVSAVAVFAGANAGTNPANLELAARFGEALARRGITLVYGGSRLGVMGRVAQATVDAGGSAIGVLTHHLASYELQFDRLDSLELVDTVAQRKQRMSQLSDAVVALPGGTGTLDELFSEWTKQQLGYHRSPIGLLGVEFWTPFMVMINHMVEQGFIRHTDQTSLILAGDADELISALLNWVPPVPRWT